MATPWTSGHSSRVPLQLVGAGSWAEVPAQFCYDAADPFAVRIVFGDVDEDGDADGVVWLLDRDLLRAALERPAGEGDVRLWPARAATDVLFLQLRAPSGEALFEVSRAPVAAFLRATEAIVPVGTEAGRLRLDEQLQALLSPGGPDPTVR